MRHEGKLVGWVGLNSVGTGVRRQPFDGRSPHRSAVVQGMYCYMPGLIIGGQQILAFAVGGQKGGPAVGRYPPVLCQPSGAVVYPPVVGDFTGDGRLEVAALSEDAVYIWNPEGLPSAYLGTQAAWGQATRGSSSTMFRVQPWQT